MQQVSTVEPHDYVMALAQLFTVLDQVGTGQAAAQTCQRSLRDLIDAARLHSLRLTKRERNCLHLIAEGKSNGEIASELGLAIPTVATHVDRARAKLQAKTRAQAVAHYMLACLL